MKTMKAIAVILGIISLLILAGCAGTTLTTGGGRIKSPAGTLIIKDESLDNASNQNGSQTAQKEYYLTVYKEDASPFSEDEFGKIMAKKFSLKDSKGKKYDVSSSGLDDDGFMLVLGFTVPESASGFKLEYPDSNPIVLRY